LGLHLTGVDWWVWIMVVEGVFMDIGAEQAVYACSVLPPIDGGLMD